jgi:hypothetical protein
MTSGDSNAKRKLDDSGPDADEINLDLEMEKLIRKLDEATTQATSGRPSNLENLRASPAREPEPISLDASMEMEDYSDQSSDVIDLVDEFETPPSTAESEFDETDSASRSTAAASSSAGRTVIDLSPEEFGELIKKSVEAALRSFFSKL